MTQFILDHEEEQELDSRMAELNDVIVRPPTS